MVKITNKKAWLKVVESTISIVLILGAMLIIYQKNTAVSFNDVQADLPSAIDEIAKNQSIRSEMVQLNINVESERVLLENKLTLMLSKNINRNELNYSVKICSVDSECLVPTPTSIVGDLNSYVRIFSTDLAQGAFKTELSAKKARFSIWKIK